MIEWFDVHYPGKCTLKKSAIHKYTMLGPKNEHGYYGRIHNDKFEAWVFRGDDADKSFYAADPDFFTKVDAWFKSRILDESWAWPFLEDSAKV